MRLLNEMTNRWRFALAFLVVLKVTVVCGEGEPRLELYPSSIQKSLGESVYVSCQANVPNADLISDMKWYAPDGSEIPNEDQSIQVLDGPGGKNRLELLIESLREEQTGTYNCTATYAGNQALNTHIAFKAYKGIDFQDTEVVQKPIKGSDAKIKCHVSAEPSPFVDWLKNGLKLESDDRHIMQQDGILIKNVDEQDEGVYRCRARVPELGEIDYRDIQVEVLVAPRITGPPQNMSGVEKESASFECVATGKPPPSYSWTNPENEAVLGKEGYFVDEVRGTLTIIPLSPHHSGRYRCTASNAAGDVTSEATLIVHTKPRVEEHKNHTMALGKDAEITCILTGEPLPTAVFKKEVNEEAFVNGVNSDNRIEVLQQQDDQGRRVGILRINELQRSDDGLYTCSGESSGGKTVSWNHMTVEFPPTFDDQPQDEFWSWEEKAVNLTCLATSIPNATVQWYLHNEPIPTNNPSLKVLSLGPNAILQVTPTGGTFFSDYKCVASNPLGTAEHTVSLSQVRKPGPVSSSQVDKKTATTISWTLKEPQNNGGRPVVGFTVQYRPIDISWDQATEKYWPKGSDSSYLLDHLSPQTEYVFRFAARNDVGDGEWSGEKGETTPKRNAPEEPYVYSANSKKVSTIPYTDHYEVQWHVPLDNGEPIDHFQIVYYQVRNSTTGWTAIGTKQSVMVKFPGDSRYLLEELSSDTYYKVELRAHNELGYSTPGEIVFRTAYAPTISEDAAATLNDKSVSSVTLIFLSILLIVILLIIDVILFFKKDIGVIAFIVDKIRSRGSARDKEAMLEDGTNSKETDKQKIQKEEQQHQQQVDVDDEKPEVKPEPNASETKDSSV